jgi:hypothetical protein
MYYTMKSMIQHAHKIVESSLFVHCLSLVTKFVIHYKQRLLELKLEETLQ